MLDMNVFFNPLFHWCHCVLRTGSQVTAGKTGVARVEQVTGLMERLVITLQRFVTVELLLKINFASGMTSDDYL